MLRIGIVAGEASGDYLGSHLIKALRAEHGEISVEGIGGELMISEGCLSLFPMEKLSVMGLVEVLDSYMELVGIRKRLLEHFTADPPDVFIGIDAPDFNLGLEQNLHRQEIPTVHYVSPSVWAWRRRRLSKIRESVDLMLTLFPFETAIYRENNIEAVYVGHPLAEKIKLKPDKLAARDRLGLDKSTVIIGIMPGSRNNEIRRLLPPFLESAKLCHLEFPNIQFVSSVLDSKTIEYCEQIQLSLSAQDLPLKMFKDKAHDVLEASDVLVLASGTVTLEAMLFKKPMVVAYKLNPVSHFIVKMMTYIDHAALPNLLSGQEVVPECLQNKCSADNLFKHIKDWINKPEKINDIEHQFTEIHSKLKLDSGVLASRAILNLLEKKQND